MTEENAQFEMSEDYESLEDIAIDFRKLLEHNKYILLYAHNGIGKTQLSMKFKDQGRNQESDIRDTLYFNAFTEDLFFWDNDLDNDEKRELRLNTESKFFNSLIGSQMDMESKIQPFLTRYTDIEFKILTKEVTSNEITKEVTYIQFSKKVLDTEYQNIKVSRGEENIFIWCFFLAVVELAIQNDESYSWVQYIYIDDPISSLDDSNAIHVASHLAQLLKRQNHVKNIIISTHHILFFNILCNETNLRNSKRFTLDKNQFNQTYKIINMGKRDTPNFYHIAMLVKLYEDSKNDQLYTYHFNILRSILEKTAVFHGLENYKQCIYIDGQVTIDESAETRMIDILSHGNYAVLEPIMMVGDNKQRFKLILKKFIKRFGFNKQLFSELDNTEFFPEID